MSKGRRRFTTEARKTRRGALHRGVFFDPGAEGADHSAQGGLGIAGGERDDGGGEGAESGVKRRFTTETLRARRSMGG